MRRGTFAVVAAVVAIVLGVLSLASAHLFGLDPVQEAALGVIAVGAAVLL